MAIIGPSLKKGVSQTWGARGLKGKYPQEQEAPRVLLHIFRREFDAYREHANG